MRLSKSLGLAFVSLVAAQEWVAAPKGLQVVSSKLFNGAEISYKKTSVCETTEGVSAYSGYVSLPKSLLPDFQHWDEKQRAHLFFWYFEARNNPSTAPTSIYIGGGPGSSSFDNTNGFPCSVNADSNSTTLNEISWNKHVNMLYIDQPLGTGFSYVDLVNGTFDTLTQTFTPVKGDKVPDTNGTFLQATFDSGELETVPKACGVQDQGTDAPLSCTDEQLMALAVGEAKVEDWVVVEPKGRKPKAMKVERKGRFV
ncbi:carboxypeptidase S1 like A [Fusarium circinatum]|uniref:Carboxypeptidase S1 like A n=1 Tax=Fusarium circinatum TaxID=48490 RepID=A0A8H5T2C4_FUSCI|nr:carboxypeptidase S1 like A [Fusarium circinatum]